MKPLNGILEAAISAGTEIDIIYQGGSHPGAVRTVLPLRITDGLLRARDSATGQSKSFKLELISLPEKEVPDELNLSFRNYHSIQDILFLEQKLILRSDLIVLADRFHIRLFKTEKASNSDAPLFSIGYQKFRKDSQLHKLENLRPWICNGAFYDTLQQAAEAFVMALRFYVKDIK